MVMPVIIGMLPSKMLVRQTYGKKIVISLLVVLVGVIAAQAKEWHGILPLHSTRADVERLLGKPEKSGPNFVFYKFNGEEVIIRYAKGPCDVEPNGWSVLRDTVIDIILTPESKQRFADLKLEEGKYQKERDYDKEDLICYTNLEEGISYEINTEDGIVNSIRYFQASKDNHLRCPNLDSNVGRTYKVDEYSSIPYESEKKRLDVLANRLLLQSSAQGYIMVYSGRRSRRNEAQLRAKRAREYLVQKRGIDSRRIIIIDGGYRESLTVELYIVPYGSIPPPSRPTIKSKD